MKRTLGGQRLGSGNKMEVDLHGFERSTHDLSYIWRSTMSAGTLVPFLRELALPGDTFDIDLNCDIKTHPTIGPLFGSYKVQLDVFVAPIRLYHSALHNNRLGIGMNMAQVKLPKIKLLATYMTDATPDIDNSQINPSCIMSYLGIRGVGTVGSLYDSTFKRKFNAVPFLMYWEIYKNYYSNKQEEVGYVVSSSGFAYNITSIESNGSNLSNDPDNPSITPFNDNDVITINYTGTVPDPARIIVVMWPSGREFILDDLALDGWTPGAGFMTATYNTAKYGERSGAYYKFNYSNAAPALAEFPLADIDAMRDKILQKPYNQEFLVNDQVSLEPYSLVLQTFNNAAGKPLPVTIFNQEGLGIKTYQSDLFNNWLSTEWIDGTGGINEITAVDTSGGSFNIDALNLSKKVYDMLNRIAVSGGSYDDWLEAVYDHDAYNRAESPVYCGGLIKELVFQEVVSNSQATGEDGSQPLGTLAGKGVMSNKHKGGKVIVKVDEPSYIMGIVSLTPRLDYSQGNKWDNNLDTLDDLHKPSLDQIGFQELITEQMAWWTTASTNILTDEWSQKSAGKQPAWINYMTNVNEVRGNFAVANNEMFMVLNRRYTPAMVDEGDWTIQDLTTYVDPTLFNHIFAQTSLDAQNFWTQISVDMIARRKMSAKIMPNL